MSEDFETVRNHYSLSDEEKAALDRIESQLRSLTEERDAPVNAVCDQTWRRDVQGACPVHGGDSCLVSPSALTEENERQAALIIEQGKKLVKMHSLKAQLSTQAEELERAKQHVEAMRSEARRQEKWKEDAYAQLATQAEELETWKARFEEQVTHHREHHEQAEWRSGDGHDKTGAAFTTSEHSHPTQQGESKP